MQLISKQQVRNAVMLFAALSETAEETVHTDSCGAFCPKYSGNSQYSDAGSKLLGNFAIRPDFAFLSRKIDEVFDAVQGDTMEFRGKKLFYTDAEGKSRSSSDMVLSIKAAHEDYTYLCHLDPSETQRFFYNGLAEFLSTLVKYYNRDFHCQLGIVIGSGRSIKSMYKMSSSCMRSDSRGELSIYMDNSQAVECLCSMDMYSNHVEYKSKALVWKDVAGDYLLEKSYEQLHIFHAAVCAIANDNPLFVKDVERHFNIDRYSSSGHAKALPRLLWLKDIRHTRNNTCLKHHAVKLTITEGHAEPYLDTLLLDFHRDFPEDVDEGEVWITNSPVDDSKVLRNTNFRRFRAGDNKDYVAYDICDSNNLLTEEDMEDEYTYVSESFYGRSDGLSPACNSDMACYSDYTDDRYHEDDVCYSDHENTFILEQDVVRLYDDDCCHSDHAVEIVGEHWNRYAYEEDANIYRLYDDRYGHIDDIDRIGCGQYEDEYAYAEDDEYIVCLYDGRYCHRNDAVQLEDGEWAWSEDDDVVELHDGKWSLKDDAVQLYNGEWAYENKCIETITGLYALDDDDALERCLELGEYYISKVNTERREIYRKLGQLELFAEAV